LPALAQMGCGASFALSKAGFFPKGGGQATVYVDGHSLFAPVKWIERGRLRRLEASIVTCRLPSHVAERAEQTMRKHLAGYGGDLVINRIDLEGGCAGAAVTIAAICPNGAGGWSALGEIGKPIERVAEEPVR